MTISTSAPASELNDKARAVLRLLNSGKARIVSASSGSFELLLPGHSIQPVARALVRELMRAGLLRGDGEGGLLLATSADAGKPSLSDAESPLARLRTRKDSSGQPYISLQQFEAGERLRTDYERSELQQRVTASWSGERVDNGAHASLSDNRLALLADRAIDARRRLHAAFDEVGPELAAVLYYVCCMAGGIEQAERFLALPLRSGKAILSLALTRLARHYKLLGSPASSAKAHDIGHWALADFRPVIPPREQPRHQP